MRITGFGKVYKLLKDFFFTEFDFLANSGWVIRPNAYNGISNLYGGKVIFFNLTEHMYDNDIVASNWRKIVGQRSYRVDSFVLWFLKSCYMACYLNEYPDADMSEAEGFAMSELGEADGIETCWALMHLISDSLNYVFDKNGVELCVKD